MMLKIKIIFFILFLSFLNAKPLSYSFNNFGFDLFKQINSEKDENILISPLSIGYALMMVNQGASGSTFDNILSTLNIKSTDLNKHYHFIQKYIDYLNDNNVYINNSIWIQKDKCYIPNNNYISFVDSVFGANAFYVDFSKNTFTIIQDINDWISGATNSLIQNMVSDNDIKKTTVQALLNTLYFKDQWLVPFDSTMTKLDFFNTNSSQEEIYMMNKQSRYPYYDNENFQLLELQYVNSDISMLFFLPKDDVGLDSLINYLDVLEFQKSLDSLKLSKGNVSIPKFKLESSTSLKEHLQSMGMTIPFSPYLASFDGFWSYDANCFKSPPNHYIDVINHKTNINLDENGAEVAAATSVIINRITSISPFDEPFSFIANKPFFYVIYDKNYNNLIFIGKYIGS